LSVVIKAKLLILYGNCEMLYELKALATSEKICFA